MIAIRQGFGISKHLWEANYIVWKQEVTYENRRHLRILRYADAENYKENESVSEKQ